MEARKDTDVQIVLQRWVEGRKTNRTIKSLVSSEVFPRTAGLFVIEFHPVKLMIRGIRAETVLTFSQTLNR